MHIIPAIADRCFSAGGVGAGLAVAPEPRVVCLGALGFCATVFVPFDVGLGAKDASSAFAEVLGGEEGADVEADAVVEIGVPADGLGIERLPANEDVVGGLAFENFHQLGLQRLGGAEAFGGSGFVGLGVGFLGVNPVAKVGVGELLERGVVELVVVHDRAEAVLAAVPNVPEEGAVVKQLGVLLEELVAQPVFQSRRFCAGGGENFALIEAAQSRSQESTKAGGGRLLAVYGGKADDAIVIRQRFQAIRAERRAIGKT